MGWTSRLQGPPLLKGVVQVQSKDESRQEEKVQVKMRSDLYREGGGEAFRGRRKRRRRCKLCHSVALAFPLDPKPTTTLGGLSRSAYRCRAWPTFLLARPCAFKADTPRGKVDIW